MQTTADKTNKNVKLRTFIGEVVSTSTKTASVLVRRMIMHAKYKKQYPVVKKFAVHDEKQLAKIGNKVEFKECRPLSKSKKWRLTKVL